MLFVGIDNGVTGSIAGIRKTGNRARFEFISPGRFYTKSVEDYQTDKRSKGKITRIDPDMILQLADMISQSKDVSILIERPLKNPKLFVASISAARAHESTLFALDYYGLSYSFIDSRVWQNYFFSKKLNSAERKREARLAAEAIYPEAEWETLKGVDGDAVMIAHYAYIQHERKTETN